MVGNGGRIMPRHVDANKAIEILRTFRDSEARGGYEQGINRGIKLACWVLSDDRVLPKMNGVYLPEEKYKELLEYKNVYENLCK